MEEFRITVASLPERENLVAEVFYKGIRWVEISHEAKEFIVQCYSHPEQKYWELPYDKALRAIEQAKEKLANMDERRK